MISFEGWGGFHNVAETYLEDNELVLSRVPLSLRSTLNENARLRTGFMTGSEIRFNLKGERAAITLRMVGQPALIELYNGTFFAGWHIIGTTPTRIDITPPLRLDLLRKLYQTQGAAFDPDLYRIILPWSPEVHILGLEGDVMPPRREQTPVHRYLAYGSSITYGNSGIHPTGMYAQRIAQRLGVDLLNLAFGGGAHLEPQMADYIASRDDWDFATFEFGINLVNQDISLQEFVVRVEYFLNAIASKNPDKPLFVLDMFPFYGDYDSSVGDRPIHFRNIVRKAVTARASDMITHIEARNLLTPITGLQTDVLHPSPQGMEEIGEMMAAIIRATVWS